MTPNQKRAHARNYAIMRLCGASGTMKSIMHELTKESMRSVIIHAHLKKALRAIDNATESLRLSNHHELYK